MILPCIDVAGTAARAASSLTAPIPSSRYVHRREECDHKEEAQKNSDLSLTLASPKTTLVRSNSKSTVWKEKSNTK